MTGKPTTWNVVAAFLTAASMTSITRTDAVSLESAKLSGDKTIQTPIGDIDVVYSYFDDDAAKRLFDDMDYRRAAPMTWHPAHAG